METKLKLYRDAYLVQYTLLLVFLIFVGVALTLLGFKVVDVDASIKNYLFGFVFTSVGLGLVVGFSLLLYRVVTYEFNDILYLLYNEHENMLELQTLHYGSLVFSLEDLLTVKIINKNAYLEFTITMRHVGKTEVKDYTFNVTSEEHEELSRIKEKISIGLKGFRAVEKEGWGE